MMMGPPDRWIPRSGERCGRAARSRRGRQHAEVLARVVGVDDEVGRRPLLQPRPAEPGSRAPQRPRASASAASGPGVRELGDLRGDQAVRERAAGVGAGVDRDARRRRPRRTVVVAAACSRRMCAA